MLIEGMAEALEKTQKNIGIGPLLDLLIAGRPVPVAAHAARKSDRTRRLILDCANQLLISEGAHGFTLRAVADKAGLSQGNLTYHFASKRQLLEAMIDDRILDRPDQIALARRARYVGGHFGRRALDAVRVPARLSPVEVAALRALVVHSWRRVALRLPAVPVPMMMSL